MYKMSSKVMFMTFLIMSTLMIMSSNNMFMMWMGMEINLMAFMPLVLKKTNNLSSQSMMMYFLVQSMSSMLFIMMMMSTSWVYNEIKSLIMMMSMSMKMGIPPFHMWMPDMMKNMSWNMCFILMTWQKMGPMNVMSELPMTNFMIYMMIIISCMVGSIMGLGHTHMRKIMAYSSINNMGWMLASEMMFKKSWIIYMMMYMLMMLIIINMLAKYNINYVNQIFINTSIFEKMMLSMTMLSMGGIPPFLGFLPKWMVIHYMIISNEMIMLVIMMITTIITLIYYLRVMSSMFLLSEKTQKWQIFYKNMSMLYMMYINMSLPMMLILINMF